MPTHPWQWWVLEFAEILRVLGWGEGEGHKFVKFNYKLIKCVI